MYMKILFLGEIVGRAGLFAVRNLLKDYKKEKGVDLVIANAEGTTSGFGLGVQHAMTLFKYGVDVITGGEKLFFKLDMQEFISRKDRILRPANYPEGVPGRGIKYLTVGDRKVFIINLLGTADMLSTHLSNPFLLAENLVDRALAETPFILVQFHASTTAEKAALGYDLNGKASAVIGTHCKVLSADARILDKGTAYISDNGRTGSFMSVGGFKPANEVQKMVNATFVRSFEWFDDCRMQGVLVTLGADGRAEAIETVDIKDPAQTNSAGTAEPQEKQE